MREQVADPLAHIRGLIFAAVSLHTLVIVKTGAAVAAAANSGANRSAGAAIVTSQRPGAVVRIRTALAAAVIVIPAAHRATAVSIKTKQ